MVTNKTNKTRLSPIISWKSATSEYCAELAELACEFARASCETEGAQEVRIHWPTQWEKMKQIQEVESLASESHLLACVSKRKGWTLLIFRSTSLYSPLCFACTSHTSSPLVMTTPIPTPCHDHTHPHPLAHITHPCLALAWYLTSPVPCVQTP